MSISSTREEEGGEADSGKAATGRAVADRRVVKLLLFCENWGSPYLFDFNTVGIS